MSMKKLSLRAVKFFALGCALGAVLYIFIPVQKQTVVATLYSISYISQSALLSISLKNSVASLATIFLGAMLCFAELAVYKGVSRETYNLFERATEPLYVILNKLGFPELRHFFRSCYFYLAFVPSFSMLINGGVFGFLAAYNYFNRHMEIFIKALLPHAALEIPAMLASAALGFHIAERAKVPIRDANLTALEKDLKKLMIDKNILKAAFLIQLTLFLAAVLEAKT